VFALSRALLWLVVVVVVVVVCGSAPAAADSVPPVRDNNVVRLVRTMLGSSIQAELAPDRVLNVDLQNHSVEGTDIAGLVMQLALKDSDTELVVLREVHISNGRAADKLEIEDVAVPFALAFSNMKFDDGVTFKDVNFSGSLTFDGISSHGKLFIDRSSFERGIFIVDKSDLAPQSGDKTVLYINKTQITRDMLIGETIANGTVEFFDNQIEPALRIKNAAFSGGAKIRDNGLADPLVYDSSF
jgi:hypothetical protein